MIKEIKTGKIKKYEIRVGDNIYYVIVDSIRNWRDFYINKKNYATTLFELGYTCDNVVEEISKHIVEWICDYEDELRRMENNYE